MERYRPWFYKLVPNKLFCYFEPKRGCIYIGILFIVINVLSVIATVIQAIGLQECDDCNYNSWRHAFSYSVSACIYSCLMLLVNLWFLWGVYMGKKSMILSWVVISALWLVQTACLFAVLLVEYFSEVSLVMWILSFVFTVVTIVLLGYFIMVAYGYWLMLRDMGAAAPTPEDPKLNSKTTPE